MSTLMSSFLAPVLLMLPLLQQIGSASERYSYDPGQPVIGTWQGTLSMPRAPARFVQIVGKIAGYLPSIPERDTDHPCTVNLRQNRHQRVTGFCHAQTGAGIDKRGYRQTQSFVTTIGDHKIFRRKVMQLGQQPAHFVSGGLWVPSEAIHIEKFECFFDPGSGRERIFVRVQLEYGVAVRLLTPLISRHPLDIVAFVTHGAGLLRIIGEFAGAAGWVAGV